MHAVTHPVETPTNVATPSRPNPTWRRWRVALAWLAACVVLPFGLAACGGSDGVAPTTATSVTAVIDAAGGTVTGPDGIQVIIPPGALSQVTTIGIARSVTGAPDALEAFPVAGNVYEFTPHDVIFNSLVTIRAPVPSGASGTNLFMASLGQNWKQIDAVVTNGVGEWQRNSFSFGYYGTGLCSVPTVMINDPYWCVNDRSYARFTATPTQAMTQTSAPILQLGDAGSYRVDQAATLQMASTFEVAGNCRNVGVSFLRSQFNANTSTWSARQVVATQSPTLVVSGGKRTGTATFPLGVTSLDNGKNRFTFVVQFECPKVLHANSTTVTGWDPVNYTSRTVADGMIVEVNITQPAVVYTIGGNVNGLTGTGLVLQNNGGDYLSLATGGSFNFATAVASGASYAVTVQTQPTGQTCTVSNGSGTVNAAVSNVTVSCAATGVTSSISGSVTYTASASVVLQNNGTDTITARSDYSFSFPTLIAAGSPYDVTVLTAPAGQSCVVLRGSGTAPQLVGFEVQVDCTDLPPSNLALLTYSNLDSLRTFKLDTTTGAPLPPSSDSITGDYPFGITIAPNRQFAYVTNLSAGTVTSYTIDAVLGQLTSTGSVAVAGPYAVAVDPRSQFAWVVDNNNGQVRSFTIDGTSGVLTVSGAPAATGSRPHSLVVHASGNYVYVTNELSNSVSALRVDPSTGALTLINTLSNSVLTPQRIVIDPLGQFVYALSAGGNRIEVFQVNPSTGALAAAGSAITTSTPIDIAMHPSGSWLYVLRGGGAIRTFAISPTGALTDAGEIGVAEGGFSMVIDSAGSYLYVGVNGFTVFSISLSTGALTDTGFFDSSIGNTAPARIALPP